MIECYPKLSDPSTQIIKNRHILFLGKVELHGKQLEIEHSVPKKQR